MHPFFARHFTPNLYKDVFLRHFDSECKKNLIIVSVCCWNSIKLRLDIFAKHFEIKNLFGNFILPFLFNQPNWYVYLFTFYSVATPAFYGYSGSSLAESQNIAKTVNQAIKLARRQKIATIYPAI